MYTHAHSKNAIMAAWADGAASGQRLVILHAFVKKTAKTPRSDIHLALERAKEVL